MKTVLITGASRGIGRTCATFFAKNNYNVVINYNKSEKEAKELLEELKDYSVRIFKADVSNSFEASLLVKYTISEFERIDVLINNAGISQSKLFTEITFEDWQEMINVNLNSVFYTSQSAVNFMKEQMFGHIINISSIWGIVGGSYEVHYSTSKAGIIGMSKALAKEIAPYKIKVNVIAPGAIKTDMLNDLSDETIDYIIDETPLSKIGDPIDIAKCAYYLAESDFLTGQVISPNGGIVI
ncbi:MAG: SDR family NAD(P)-dependent oxidoreductase [Peptostreptococcaceae bacterium]